MLETPCDFASKYTKTNFVSRRLIDGFYRTIEAMVRPLGIQSALEVGCGEGFSTMRLRQILPGAHLEASDVEDRLIAQAKRNNPAVEVARESIYDLNRTSKSVDLVIALEVLEHLEDPHRGLGELCRVSRRWMVASVPREPLWRGMNLLRLKYVVSLGNTPGHLQHWSPRGFARFIGGHARVRQVRTPLPWTVVLAEVL